MEYDLRFSAEQGMQLCTAVTRSGRNAVRTVIDSDRVQLPRANDSAAGAKIIDLGSRRRSAG